MNKKFYILPFIFSLCFGLNANAQTNYFKNCVQNAANVAISQGANEELAQKAIFGIEKPNEEIIALSKVQPESNLKIWDYLAFAIDDERANEGAKAFIYYKDFLYDLGVKTGVDPSIVIGIWGMETNFGKIIGKRNIIDALSTLGCTNWRRSKYFKSELIAAIKIEASGNVKHENFIGSWAGAFGQTQFMPTSFLSLALDGNNNGIKNIIEEPEDALLSSANFLKKAGYIRGEIWGFEAILPPNYKGPYGRKNKKPISYYNYIGVKRADGKDLPLIGNFGLIFPAGSNGPAFLVGRNFDAVYAYNPAIAYALAVSLLSDKIKGSKGVYGKWPTNDIGIDRAKKREIQTLLTKKGYDIGPIDGILGEKALIAITDLYLKNGLKFDGRVGQNAYEIILKIAN